MRLLQAPVAGLAWIGRQGSRAVALLVFIGIAFPALGAFFRPIFTGAICVLLVITFLRVDLTALRGYLRRPGLVLLASVWTSLLIPALTGLASRGLGLAAGQPDFHLALVLQAMAAPLLAAPALAALLGLDTALVLATVLVGHAILPFAAPLFAWVFLGSALAIDPLALGFKLLWLLGGAALVGLVLRRLAGEAAVARRRHELDGLNILVLLVLMSVVNRDVAACFLAAPLRVLGLTVVAFLVFFVHLGLTGLIFAKSGWGVALALGLTVAQRNLGIMLAAGGALPATVWLYFAVAQLPIFLAPGMLLPLTRRVLSPGALR